MMGSCFPTGEQTLIFLFYCYSFYTRVYNLPLGKAIAVVKMKEKRGRLRKKTLAGGLAKVGSA